jgi:hypothetical protein
MVAGRSEMIRDPGTFWHEVVGENILANRQVPHEDTFNFTREGRPWITDYWLAEIVMAAVHRLAGWDGLLSITAAIDDRCTLYGSDFLFAYDGARREKPQQLDLWQQQYQFRYALVETGSQFDLHLHNSRQWIVLGRSISAALYQLRD